MAGSFFRRAILSTTHNRQISTWVRRHGMRMGAARFVAGETLDECVQVLRRLNSQGLVTNTTLLGEGVKEAANAAAVVAEYERILDRIADAQVKTNIALKLTHLGLNLSPELAYQNLEHLVTHAAQRDNFLRIDMEESFRVDATIGIYRRLRAAGHDNVGMVLQAYLYRSAVDLESLLPLCPNLRLVKGAYLEPATVAYPRKADVDRNYVKLAERSLTRGGYTCIATHDNEIIRHVVDFASRHGIDRSHFEFQMLYGVRPELQRQLVEQGYRVLVATPFGPEWYFYLMRRLAERPANLFFVLRNLLRA